jgi:membrane protein
MLDLLATRIDKWLFEPPEHFVGKPLQPLLRLLRYPYALIRDLMQGQLTLRAMGLVYTTLLSIAPLLALAFSLLKGLGYDQYLEPVLYQLFTPFGDKAKEELSTQIMGFVASARGDVLGALGLAFLIYTSLSAIQKVEESFNYVWRVEKPRSWARRVSEYLSVMIVGPVVVVAIFGIFTAIKNSFPAQSLAHIGLVNWALQYLAQINTYLLISATFTFLYWFVPNARVRLKTAVIGGLIAGALWTAAGVLFAYFVATSKQNAAIYAGFAIVIAALFWLYTSWQILLVGAQLSFYLQHPQNLRAGKREIELTAALRERLGLSVMYLIARDFKQSGTHWTLNGLAEQLGLPASALKPVLDTLEARRLLVGTDHECYVPARDINSIELLEILDAVRNDADNPYIPRIRCVAAAEAVAHAASEALRNSMQGKTLAALVNDAG